MAKHAYVTLLYGRNQSYALGAAVLGDSLARTGSPHDRVLLHTNDVPRKTLTVLAEIYDVVREVDYISADPALFKSFDRTQFKANFTKLHLFALSEYDTVLYLDSDMLVLRSMDELFTLEAPAAVPMIDGDFAFGEQVAKERFYFSNGDFKQGVNGGLMLFRPNAADFSRFVNDVTTPRSRTTGYAYAEQGYLSEIYAGEWRAVPHWFNFQFHLRREESLAEKYSFEHLKDRVHCVHYSALLPWLFLWPQTDATVLSRYESDAPAMQLWLAAFSDLRLRFLAQGFDLLSLVDEGST